MPTVPHRAVLMAGKRKADPNISYYEAKELESLNLDYQTPVQKKAYLAKLERVFRSMDALLRTPVLATPPKPKDQPAISLGEQPSTDGKRSNFHEYPDFKSKIRSEGIHVRGTVTFSYVKSTGEVSRRTVDVTAAYPVFPTHILGVCRLRAEERTFAVGSMSEVVDAVSGEAVDDIIKWLYTKSGA